MVKSFLSGRTLSAWRPRGDSSLLNSTYAGKSERFGLYVPAADHGQLLVLYTQPLGGLTTFGDSSTASTPFHSVRGSLPSTGRVQSNDVSRRGMKLEWKYAMSPSASAKVVLFDELVWSSIVRRNDLRSRAFIRVNDWINASIGRCISLTLTHFPFCSRTIGP